MTFGVEYAYVLLLLPFALAPLFRSAFRASAIPSLDAAPPDQLSRVVAIGLKLFAAVAIAALLVALARPFRFGRETVRIGEGAEVVMLIDRSGSMNETFAGRQPSGGEESKTSAAKRLLQAFVDDRKHDMVGVAAFSTSPMLVMPMTDHHAAVKAAIDAIDRPGLDYTNIGRGLAMALSMVRPGAPDGSRALLLLSDGAGVIDPRIQDELRADFQKANVNLYWLFLRSEGSRGLYDQPEAESDTPQAMPERHLDLFFKSLRTPYHAYQAESADAVAEAIRRIDQLERHPIRYVEKPPREDVAALAYAIALASIFGLLLAKLAEVRLPRSDHRQTPDPRPVAVFKGRAI